MILIGCIIPGLKADERAAELKALVAERRKTGPVTMITSNDFIKAMYLAEEKKAAGELVSVAASMSDITVPPEFASSGIGVQEWRESWIWRLENENIGVIQMDLKSQPVITKETIAATVLIRKYERAKTAMDQAIKDMQSKDRQEKAVKRAIETGYVCGRPPYGYHAINGGLVHNQKQGEAVRLIFTTIRKGGSGYDVLTALKESKAKGYWDGVKIRRILKHSRLYCLGECTFRGKTVTIPDLAFLPPEWAGTKSRRSTK